LRQLEERGEEISECEREILFNVGFLNNKKLSELSDYYLSSVSDIISFMKDDFTEEGLKAENSENFWLDLAEKFPFNLADSSKEFISNYEKSGKNFLTKLNEIIRV